MRRLKKLSAVFDKLIPIVKYRIPSRLRVGDIIVLRGNSTSLRAKVCDIQEHYVYDKQYFLSNITNISQDLYILYEDKLKEILNNQGTTKIYLVYVKIMS